MNTVAQHQIDRRGFVHAHTPSDAVDEVVMSATQQLANIQKQKEKIKPFLDDPKTVAKAQAMLGKLNRMRRKLEAHLERSCNREALLVKRLMKLVTPEQFRVAAGMADADVEAIRSQVAGLYEDHDEDMK